MFIILNLACVLACTVRSLKIMLYLSSFAAQLERKLVVLLICYGVTITLLHLMNVHSFFKLEPETFLYLQKRQVYFGSPCSRCDELVQNGIETKGLADIDLLVAIPSAVGSFDRRQRIRETWGKTEPTFFKKKAVYFFLAKSENQTMNEAVRLENQRNHDIVQAAFVDSYENLTYKTLSILYWAYHRMAEGKFMPKWIFKVDDDNMVDIFMVENYLLSVLEQETDHKSTNEILCYVRDDAVPVRPGSAAKVEYDKWIVDHKAWPDPLYPRCCYGPAYVLSPVAIYSIVNAYENGISSFSNFEDIFITGVLASAANTTLVHFPPGTYVDWATGDAFIIHRALTAWSDSKLDETWSFIESRGLKVLEEKMRNNT